MSSLFFVREAQDNLIQMEEQMDKILSDYRNSIEEIYSWTSSSSSADYLMAETDDISKMNETFVGSRAALANDYYRQR